MLIRPFETGFQFLMNQLLKHSGDQEHPSYLWAGAAPKSGVTTVLSSFVSYLAGDMGRSVLLCDGNFQNSALTRHWGLEQAPGLVDVMAGKANPTEAVHETDIPGLFVMPLGDPKLFPSVIGGRSLRSGEILNLLTERFGLVVLDSAPPSVSPEACYLASQVSGVLLVIQAEKTRREVVQSVKDRLESLGANIVGGVLNRRKYHIPASIYRLLA